MQATMFFQFPEFTLAAIVGALCLFFGLKRQSGSVPVWLSAPAVSILSSAPQRYLGWLLQRLTWSGFRSNTAFGTLATCKIFMPLLASTTLCFLPTANSALIIVLAFFLPDLFLVHRSNKRQTSIRETLPQALDLMVLCVDAGLGLDATLQRIAAERTDTASALNDELGVLGRDVLLGMERDRAYQELYKRTGVEELKALGSSLNQSAKLGISIAKILRSQADFLRMKLAQKAEEKAAKLPIYMSFPLWFCIMPALMVILLAPSMITFLKQAPSNKYSFLK